MFRVHAERHLPWKQRSARPCCFERLEDRRLLAQIALNLRVAALSGQPLANNEVAVGNDFLLQATVQDVRDEPTGVFAAFLDVTYDSPSAFSVVYSETQRITFSNKTTGGNFTLTFGSETTGDIQATTDIPGFVANLKSALEALPSIGPGNIEVVQNKFIDDQNRENNNDFRFEVKFINELFETDVPNLTGDPGGLTVSAGSPSLVIDEIAKGVRTDPETFRRSFTPGDDYPNGLTAYDGDRDPQTDELLDPNVLSDVGSFDGVGFFGSEGNERLLWTVRFNADAPGVINFAGSPADDPVRSDVLVFGTEDPVPLSELSFNTVSVTIVGGTGSSEMDFGDAPDPSFATRLPAGPSHLLGSGLFLGTIADAEPDGQPNASATGDDVDGSNDDDGVRQIAGMVTTTTTSTTSSFLVTASAAAKLDAWIDFDANGQFDHPSEHLGHGTGIDLGSGNNVLSFSVPAGAVAGDTFARFRLSTLGDLLPGGAAADGEVEDYRLEILDGDAGAVVPVTLLASEIEITADGDSLGIRSANSDLLFSAPGDAVTGWEITGSDNDDTVGLGNLTSAVATPVPLTFDGGNGTDTLRLTETNQTLDLTDRLLNDLARIEIIDIASNGPNQLHVDIENVLAATDTPNTLLVRHDEDDRVTYGAGWEVQPPIFAGGQQRHVLTGGGARIEIINSLPFQNPLLPTDVNFSGAVTSLDALQGINFLGRSGGATSVDLPIPTFEEGLPERYFDVNGSSTATALDSLIVINFIGRQTAEGESVVINTGAPRSIGSSSQSRVNDVDLYFAVAARGDVQSEPIRFAVRASGPRRQLRQESVSLTRIERMHASGDMQVWDLSLTEFTLSADLPSTTSIRDSDV